MNWDAVGATAELLGAIGVIVSLVYLASQIRQSSTVNRLTLQENYIAGLTDIFVSISADRELNRIWRLGNSTDEMSDEDRERLGMIYHSLFQRFELVWESGQLDSPTGRRTRRLIDRSVRSPATQSWWSRQRELYDSSFVEYVDDRMRRAQVEGSARPDENAG